ncbi:MAG: CotH kinase family protein [Calditrichaceae bacterium]|nr:CotH kinase family protein [Calditrichaceae bacterium]
MTKYPIIFLILLSFMIIPAKGQDIVINEIMASNTFTLEDEDGDYSDWIEIFNAGTDTVNLLNWGISDSKNEPFKWVFPDVSLTGGQYLVMFASDKDRRDWVAHWDTVIDWGDEWNYFPGTSEPPSNWKDIDFDDLSWAAGNSGFGYGDGDDQTELSAGLLSVYIRKSFFIEDKQDVAGVVLHIDYDDAFVAYLNGVEFARSNVGTPGVPPAYNQGTPTDREAQIYQGGQPDAFPVFEWRELLIEGENLLAIQVLNINSGSSDMTCIPFFSVGLNYIPDDPQGSPDILNLDSPSLHTNFKLSADGESVYLTRPDSSAADSLTFGKIPTDHSYGRQPDGDSTCYYFVESTPGSSNITTGYHKFAEEPLFSLGGGFYNTSIEVALESPDSDLVIHYTLDGSEPDSSSVEYSGPVSIDATTVIRAMASASGILTSPIVTKTYFINESTDLPVVSLVSDPDGLFGYENGIYADGPGWTEADPHYGANYWMDWEREASIEFFEDTRQLGFSENVIIAIFGAWSRMHPQKSFSVKFKSDRGKKELHYPLFPGFDVITFKSFLLRNSGNDFWNTHIRDAVMQAIIKDLDIDYQEYRPAVTFINGEYWGIYNIREKLSEHYLANRHHVDPDSIDMLENDASIIHGDAVHYNTFINYIDNNDMATDSSYNFVNKMIDLDNCLLYYIFEMYINNRDWPGNNLKYWRERTENGKWRWLVYDTDFGFNLYGSEEHNEDPFPFALYYSGDPNHGWPNPDWSTLIMRKLLENPVIQNKFINLFADLLNTNFKSERVVSIINDYAGHIANEIGKHRSRFGVGGEGTERMIEFAEKRPNNMRNFIRNYFGSGSNGNLTINSTEGGKVLLNSLSFSSSELPWTGIYFQNNAVQLTAVSEPGYKFTGWSGSSSSEFKDLSFNVGSSSSLTANFEIDSLPSTLVINEINYNSSDEFDPEDWIELYYTGENDLNISGWLCRDERDTNDFQMPDGTILESGDYLVLCRDTSQFKSSFPAVKNFIGNLDFGLGGNSDMVRIFDNEGIIIDSVNYEDSDPWPTGADGFGSTLELLNPFRDNSVAENWAASVGHGTPGAINSVYTSIEQDGTIELPNEYNLSQNYPNPFNPSTTIQYNVRAIHESPLQHVQLSIYNVLGQKIVTLVSENQKAGYFKIQWDASRFSSGIYFYRLVIGTGKEQIIKTKKMMLLR